MKQLSRKPFVLMLKDDSGELEAVPLDPGLINSDNALIVLDEYNDTCWVWVGRKVNMPTRMHAIRMARSLQKSGHQVGVTTIGLATSKFVEMMEKDDSDAQVAESIAAFRAAMDGKWLFDDRVLAFKKGSEITAVETLPPPKPRDDGPLPETVEARTVTETEPPRPAPAPPRPAEEISLTVGEKKAAHLLWATVKNADLAYIESVRRNETTGLKIEVPGVMVLEVEPKGSYLEISPIDFGKSDIAKKIKSEYEAMSKSL
ncbi:MAG: hypothetical protein ACTSV3_01785 [Candidatus Thorarchaeota archaeon]|nr:MAG: hypothetical protein DRP09_05005 [Candidatus Thorarchaeota archaeon]